MRLKYQLEIDKLSPCFIGYDEVNNQIAYRWVFDNILHENNFRPVALTNPGRSYDDFRYWALSFFISEDHSNRRLLHLTSNKSQLFKKLGTHIAKGTIRPSDGLSEIQADDDGHFNHFEYVDVDFAAGNFEIVKQVATLP